MICVEEFFILLIFSRDTFFAIIYNRLFYKLVNV